MSTNTNKMRTATLTPYLKRMTLAALSLVMLHTTSSGGNYPLFNSDGFQQNNASTISNLVNFSADFADGKVYLNWSMSADCGNCTYYIERSEDGIIFEVIGIKKGLPSPADQALSYSFTDKNPLIVYSFYRIRKVDSSTNSSTVSWVEIIYNSNTLETLNVNTSETSSIKQ